MRTAVLCLVFCLFWAAQAAALESEDCGSSQAGRTEERQAALLASYGESIEQALAKRYMAGLEECLSELRRVFRLRVPDFSLPGVADVTEAASELLGRAEEAVCREAVRIVREEALDLRALYTGTLPAAESPWKRVMWEFNISNQTLARDLAERLAHILK